MTDDLRMRYAVAMLDDNCSERDYPGYEVPWPCPTIRALDGVASRD